MVVAHLYGAWGNVTNACREVFLSIAFQRVLEDMSTSLQRVQRTAFMS